VKYLWIWCIHFRRNFRSLFFLWCSSEHSYLVLFSCDAAVNTACLWNLTMHLQLKKILTWLPTSLCHGISMWRTAAQLFFRHVSLSPLPWQKMMSVCPLYICMLCKVGQSSIDRGPSSYSKVYSFKFSVLFFKLTSMPAKKETWKFAPYENFLLDSNSIYQS